MSKKPFITIEQAREIDKKYDTPYHIYDEKAIVENVRAIYKAFSWNKGFKEYFAVKANPNPFILEILKNEGCGMDCSSMSELVLSKGVGVTGQSVMFSSNATPAKEYKYANDLGAIINLDDLTHVDFIKDALGTLPKKMSLRFNPGGVFEVCNGIMDNPGDAKYGMPKDQMFEAMRKLKAYGVEEFGIHAFLASNVLADVYYPMLAKILFELAVEAHKETGVNVTFINLSGGVGIPYLPDAEPCHIDVIGEGVRKAYEEVIVPSELGDVAICTEMGRFVMGPYGALVTKAVHFKHIYKEYVGCDACACNLMRPAMYGAYHHITILGKEDQPCDHKYDITGSLCENNDKFAIDRMLPEIEIGDFIYIHDTGAHGFAMGYNYNGKLWSKELLLKENGEIQLIRRAETIEDYLRTLDCFDIFNKFDFEGSK
jgi:diaminopimelate decarboxylase